MLSDTLTQALDVIVNSTPEELKQEFSSYMLGDLTNFIQRLTIIYELQKQAKDEILEKIKNNEVSPKESEKTLKDMYLYMQKIEDTVTVLKSIQKEKINKLN